MDLPADELAQARAMVHAMVGGRATSNAMRREGPSHAL
jgi:hypothetical protein